jgi:hypothetical protein
MTMKNICSNYPCENRVSKPGEVCHDCERKAKRKKAQDWKWSGWSRQDERQQATHRKPQK